MTSTAAAAKPERLHLPALTGLRWFAALAVFFHHAVRPETLPGPISRFMQSGHNGVTFFFVLSGFVIALNYFDTAARPTSRGTWNYFVGRLARVYPLYLLVLTVVWVFVDHQSNVPRFLWQLFALQSWHPSLVIAYGINAPGWSIGVEFFLYACFPLLVLVLRPIAANAKALLILAVAVIVAVFLAAALFQQFRNGLPPTDPASAHRWLYRMPATRLGDFALGMIAALLLRHLRRSWETAPPADRILSPLLTWFPLGLTVLLMASPDRAKYYASFDAFWALPAVMLFLGLGLYPQSLLSRFLSLRAVVFLGEVSFAFYLVHRPLMHLVDAESWGNDRILLYTAKSVLLVAFIVAVAAACHYLWERPAQRFLNHLLRINARPRPDVAVVAPTHQQAVPEHSGTPDENPAPKPVREANPC
jgi:peptidoglycan/LPS O-acetylase OafA/YrhL